MINLDIDMTREQLIEALSALFIVEHNRLYKKESPRMAYGVLENLSWELHRSISPKKEEWIKTDYFKEYFDKHSKERFLANV